MDFIILEAHKVHNYMYPDTYIYIYMYAYLYESHVLLPSNNFLVIFWSVSLGFGSEIWRTSTSG